MAYKKSSLFLGGIFMLASKKGQILALLTYVLKKHFKANQELPVFFCKQIDSVQIQH